ncbi:uncharacterized protein V1510DRAFT_179271 [Dipodascopsis tothii]|uniref:uncharacterized protein n=1 Tax=Dipodascopsis tothii TaxID=44089 RepID=UPI0034CD6634
MRLGWHERSAAERLSAVVRKCGLQAAVRPPVGPPTEQAYDDMSDGVPASSRVSGGAPAKQPCRLRGTAVGPPGTRCTATHTLRRRLRGVRPTDGVSALSPIGYRSYRPRHADGRRRRAGRACGGVQQIEAYWERCPVPVPDRRGVRRWLRDRRRWCQMSRSACGEMFRMSRRECGVVFHMSRRECGEMFHMSRRECGVV